MDTKRSPVLPLQHSQEIAPPGVQFPENPTKNQVVTLEKGTHAIHGGFTTCDQIWQASKVVSALGSAGTTKT